ncbi:MAG TPA: GTPase, partial [Lactobacillus sp.]|nr:GTPase [Lactobacillus sp.]
MVQGVLKSTFATTLGRSLAGNLFKLVPGAGSILGGAISAGVAVSVTEAIGQVLIKEFEDGNA